MADTEGTPIYVGRTFGGNVGLAVGEASIELRPVEARLVGDALYKWALKAEAERN